jgi:hypothetical protein
MYLALVWKANSYIADRRPVDPTPIIQLKVIDGNGDDLAIEDKAEGSRKGRLRRPDPLPSGMTFIQSKLLSLLCGTS